MKKRLSRQVGRAYCKPSQDVRLADVIPAWYVAICLHVEAGAHHACVHDLSPWETTRKAIREHFSGRVSDPGAARWAAALQSTTTMKLGDPND
jgi:hypothetical protein